MNLAWDEAVSTAADRPEVRRRVDHRDRGAARRHSVASSRRVTSLICRDRGTPRVAGHDIAWVASTSLGDRLRRARSLVTASAAAMATCPALRRPSPGRGRARIRVSGDPMCASLSAASSLPVTISVCDVSPGCRAGPRPLAPAPPPPGGWYGSSYLARVASTPPGTEATATAGDQSYVAAVPTT